MRKISKKRVSVFGIFLVISYLALSALSVGLAILAEGDNKGHFVLLQLPIVFQHAALMELGLLKYLEGMSWPEAYIYLGLPMVAFLYLVGWIVEIIGNKNNSKN
ncbi:MAG: hypothetical protein A3J37_00520 [Alphaproteobacteria bacterium RIFCSPHIGHO2_12_FULL_45_9]|nr:MAG: hypothetical protein A3B66_04875 [Alphaproteobacteria bacterium RIFCSPHIGHO2_02_FULL_46_13]OFW96559.1 MAG: hypothetical protein A3J37_00520 [Alphaproteobacteria bacterium RIFCSPHIGHO2_12_FULL_45_9]